jgi:proteasome lid subunit RPN8/RPN11
MCAISAGINERKKMFILVVVGVVHSHLNVSEKDRLVRKFPDFLFCLLVGVIRRFLQGVKEATVEDVIGEDNVGHKHNKMFN